MSKSSSTQSLADSAMAKLGQAMVRNSTLAAAAPVPPAPAPAVTATTPAPIPTPQVRVQQPRRPVRHNLHTSGLRFTAQDHERINRIINQALSMGERIPMSSLRRYGQPMAACPAGRWANDAELPEPLDRTTRTWHLLHIGKVPMRQGGNVAQWHRGRAPACICADTAHHFGSER